MSNPAPRVPSTTSATPQPIDAKASSKRVSVLVHAGLMVLAVGVVATTFGRDDRRSASASTLGAMYLGQPNPVMGSDAPRESTRHDAPSPAVSHTDTRPTHTTAASTSTVAPTKTIDPALSPEHEKSPVEVAQSNATDAPATEAPRPTQAASATQPEPMLAIPEEGQSWPVRMAPRTIDTTFAEHGGVYGLPGAARIVYVVDASGSMIDTMPFVVKELQRALRGLRADQSYAVLFMRGEGVTEVPPVGMKRANAAAVTSSVQWMDPVAGHVLPSGSASADAALRRALAYEPDAVVLLSDSLTGRADPLADHIRLISLVDTANTAGSLFLTVQLGQPDPVASDKRRGTMELIALRTGGLFRYVPENELSANAVEPVALRLP